MSFKAASGGESPAAATLSLNECHVCACVRACVCVFTTYICDYFCCIIRYGTSKLSIIIMLPETVYQ